MIVQLINPVTIHQFPNTESGKSRVITEVTVKATRILNEINKVLVDVENKTSNKADLQYATTITLWEGTEFANKDVSDAGIEAKIKAFYNK